MGNFHSTDVQKLIEVNTLIMLLRWSVRIGQVLVFADHVMQGPAEEAEEGAFDRTEAALLHAVWMAKKLAGTDDEGTLQAARDLFRAIDVNDSGFIDVEELAVAFRWVDEMHLDCRLSTTTGRHLKCVVNVMMQEYEATTDIGAAQLPRDQV